MNYTLKKFRQVNTSIFVKIKASLVPLIGIFRNYQIEPCWFSLLGTEPIHVNTSILHVHMFVLITDYTLRKIMSENDQGIVALTGMAHCQRQVAFFKFYGLAR